MLKALLLTLSAALVYASSVDITSPKPNEVWEAGSTVSIKWKVNDNTVTPLLIQYASGASKALKINGLIAQNVPVRAGQYTWKIPSNIKPKKYVIEVGPNAKDLSFAGYIEIVEKGKKPTTKKHVTTKKHSTKKTSAKKKSTKKTTTKKHSTKKTTTKKHSTKKTTTKKKVTASKKPVCESVQSADGSNKSVRCHSVSG